MARHLASNNISVAYFEAAPGLALVENPPHTPEPIFAAGSNLIRMHEEDDADRANKPRQPPQDPWRPSRQMQLKRWEALAA